MLALSSSQRLLGCPSKGRFTSSGVVRYEGSSCVSEHVRIGVEHPGVGMLCSDCRCCRIDSISRRKRQGEGATNVQCSGIESINPFDFEYNLKTTL